MSQRMGMADARCTDFLSSRLFNDAVMEKLGVRPDDAHAYRMYLQTVDTNRIWPEPTCSIFSYKEMSPENSNE
jgi:hypothetical protein